MIPFIHIEPFGIGSLVISPFGILMGMAIVAGYELSRWRGLRLGLDPSELTSFLLAILIGGLVGAHVFDALFYFPQDVVERPLLLLEMWNGFSSFGGFAGAFLGGLVWKYYGRRAAGAGGILQRLRPLRRCRPALLLPYADVAFSVFPISWIFGRLGCAIEHDHPGILAPVGSWLAVAFGPGPTERLGFIELHYGTQPRYDLGLLEMFFAVLLAAVFVLIWRTRRVCGWYIAVSCIVYPPVRFLLDFWRSADPDIGDLRYAGLTPAQWACFALFAFGIFLATRIRAGNRPTAAGPRDITS